MKILALIASLLLCAVAQAQTVSKFTLAAAPHGNYLPVATQDGVATSGIWDEDYIYDCAFAATCPGKLLQQHIAFSMPNNPAVPGQRFNGYCTGVVTTNTVPAYGAKTQQPPGILQSQETCTTNEYGYPATIWTGTLTYNYVSVFQKHCSSFCVSEWYPVLAGGSGTLTEE
jgi:hypothetical protein